MRYNLSNYQGAVQDFSIAIDLNNEDMESYFLRGLSRLFTEEFAKSIEDLEYARKLSLAKENYKMYEGIMDFIKIVQEAQ